MLQKVKHALRNQLINIPGFRTGRKIVVIESDDWGAVRQHSAKTLEWMQRSGMKLNHDHYIRNDSLASETDLISLFEVLRAVRDMAGRPAAITANTIMANPDFEKMKAGGRDRYYFEPFTETLKNILNMRDHFSCGKRAWLLIYFSHSSMAGSTCMFTDGLKACRQRGRKQSFFLKNSYLHFVLPLPQKTEKATWRHGR
jgi:hypothetical protein